MSYTSLKWIILSSLFDSIINIYHLDPFGFLPFCMSFIIWSSLIFSIGLLLGFSNFDYSYFLLWISGKLHDPSGLSSVPPCRNRVFRLRCATNRRNRCNIGIFLDGVTRQHCTLWECSGISWVVLSSSRVTSTFTTNFPILLIFVFSWRVLSMPPP